MCHAENDSPSYVPKSCTFIYLLASFIYLFFNIIGSQQ
jgi:hypothetical protein